MADAPVDAVDRLLAGELSAEEERRLAQSALDDPDLFDTLTAAAAVQAVVAERDHRETLDERSRRVTDHAQHATGHARQDVRRGLQILAGVALAAAATIAIAVGYFRSTPAIPSAPAVVVSQSPVEIAPVVLTARVERTADQTFRSEPSSSRIPRQTGTVVTVRDDDVEIDLGSLDGISEGLTLTVLHPTAGSKPSAITVTTVFRERARGRPRGGSVVGAGDRVEVNAGVHVKAILEQAFARQSAQDQAGAAKLLELAASNAESPDVPADVRRQAREQLGELRHQSGELADAARLLGAAAGEFEKAPVASSSERADALNELGAVQIEQHDYPSAERTLRSAEVSAAGAAKMRVMNNLGAVAALRGDRAAAKSFYESAHALAAESPDLASDRAVIEKNLTALGLSQ